MNNIYKPQNQFELNKLLDQYQRSYQACQSTGTSEYAPVDGYYFIKSVALKVIHGKKMFTAETLWKQHNWQPFVEKFTVTIQLWSLYSEFSIGDKNIPVANLVGQIIEIIYCQVCFQPKMFNRVLIYLVSWKISNITLNLIRNFYLSANPPKLPIYYNTLVESSSYDVQLACENEALADKHNIDLICEAEVSGFETYLFANLIVDAETVDIYPEWDDVDDSDFYFVENPSDE